MERCSLCAVVAKGRLECYRFLLEKNLIHDRPVPRSEADRNAFRAAVIPALNPPAPILAPMPPLLIFSLRRPSAMDFRNRKGIFVHTRREQFTPTQWTDIEAVAVFVAYGTKNFLSEDSLSVKGEVTGAVISIKDGREFGDATITDQELVDRSMILFSEREIPSVTRIKLNLE